jgi:hypothetical protein
MSLLYEEIVHGETLMRSPPGPRHERICARLHARMAESLANNTVARLLAPRSIVQLAPGTMLRPDLALVTAATGKLWLAVEIINSEDHQPDTVLKKTIYEDFNVARCGWSIRATTTWRPITACPTAWRCAASSPGKSGWSRRCCRGLMWCGRIVCGLMGFFS